MDSGINETAADRGYNLSGRHVERRIRFRHALASRAQCRGCQVAGNQSGKRARDTSEPSQTRKFAAAFHDASKKRQRKREREKEKEKSSIPHCIPKATNTPAGGCKASRFTNIRKNPVKSVRTWTHRLRGIAAIRIICITVAFSHETRERVQDN